MSDNRHKKPTTLECKKGTGMMILFFLFPLLLLQGCGFFAAVPVTLKEVKNYVIGQEESFSYPLDRVLAATVHNLMQTGFVVERIEHFNNKGRVIAKWEDTTVILKLESVTPRLTRVESRIRHAKAERDYSSEEEIFNNVRHILNREGTPKWMELTSGMVKVHLSPEANSPVIAFLGPGTRAQMISEDGDWGEIELMDGGSGFIPKEYLKNTSQPKEARASLSEHPR